MIRTAAAVVLAGVLLLAPASAGTVSAHGWFAPAWPVHLLDGTSPAVAAWAYSQPASFETGQPYDGFAAAPVWRETSYAQFKTDLASGAIPALYGWVSYDNEKWAATPLAEQQSPVAYMTLFDQLAHAHGYRVADTPARDLGLVDTECPKQSGEDLDAWFARCRIAQAAGYADLFQVQSQVDTTSPAAFSSLVTQVAQQARAANPYVLFYDGISDSYGTPAQAVAAQQSVASVIDGTYVTCANSDIAWESRVLSSLQQAGF